MVDVTVRRALELAAGRAGDRPALHFGGRVLTYRELDAAANRLANFLADAGVAVGARVAVVLPNCPEYVVVALACAKARMVMLPMNYRFTGEEFEHLMTDAGAAALIYGDDFADMLAPVIARMPGIVRIGHAIRRTGDASTLQLIGETGKPQRPPGDASASDLFYLGYTSGTTGRPKGAMVTQGNRALAYHYWALEFGLTDADHGLHCGPFHHTAPFTFTLTQLFLGGEVTILPAFDARAALAAIEHNRVTWSFMVPYMLERILELGLEEIGRHDLSTLRVLISGASPLSTRTKTLLLEAFPSVQLHEFYGATEAGVITNLRPVDQRRKERCVGRPVFDTEIAIRRDDGSDAAPGEVGNIWLRGPTVFSGYFNDPEKTAEAFDGDWCTIGDVGRIDEEGYLYIVDRRKDLIKSGGVNIFPIEIEEVLLANESVADVAVIGIPDPRWGEAVHAVIVVRPESRLTAEELDAHCRRHLAGYKVPKSFEFRSALPRNANNKILKRVLRQEFLHRAGRSGVPAPPGGASEKSNEQYTEDANGRVQGRNLAV